MSSNGLQVVFTGSGSAQGRKDFANRITDFAVSDIGYQGNDPVTGEQDTNCPPGQSAAARSPTSRSSPAARRSRTRSRSAGQLVRNLRLSGRDAGEDLHLPDHQLERPGDHGRQQRPQAAVAADHPGRALRGLGFDRAVHRLPEQAVPEHLAAVRRHERGDRVLAAAERRQGHRAERFGRRDELRLVRRPPTARSATTSTPTRWPRAGRWRRSRTRPATSRCPTSTTSPSRCTHAKINMDKTSQNYLLQDLIERLRRAGEAGLSAVVVLLLPDPDRRATTRG